MRLGCAPLSFPIPRTVLDSCRRADTGSGSVLGLVELLVALEEGLAKWGDCGLPVHSPGAETVCRSKSARFAISTVLQDHAGLPGCFGALRVRRGMPRSNRFWLAVWRILCWILCSIFHFRPSVFRRPFALLFADESSAPLLASTRSIDGAPSASAQSINCAIGGTSLFSLDYETPRPPAGSWSIQNEVLHLRHEETERGAPSPHQLLPDVIPRARNA